jgi:23S rRNA (adenine2503-C2)-methyltransferase
MSASSPTVPTDSEGRPAPLPPISTLLPEELQQRLGCGSGTARQLFRTISTGSAEALEAAGVSHACRVAQEIADPDGSRKLQIRLSDGWTVEAVVMQDRRGRSTLCLSSQAGCVNRCVFCYTGSLQFRRNLTAGEIIEQYHLARWRCGSVNNVVFMGMGEPLANFDAVVRAAGILTHPFGAALAPRKVTVSTSGNAESIRRYADSACQACLAFSLISADPAVRAKLFPGTTTKTLSDLRAAILYYQERRRRRVTLEVVLLGGINDGPGGARLIRDFTQGLDVHVNLIRWNRMPGLPFEEPATEHVHRFGMELSQLGVPVTVRMSRGRGIAAACGQLGSVQAVRD